MRCHGKKIAETRCFWKLKRSSLKTLDESIPDWVAKSNGFVTHSTSHRAALLCEHRMYACVCVCWMREYKCACIDVCVLHTFCMRNTSRWNRKLKGDHRIHTSTATAVVSKRCVVSVLRICLFLYSINGGRSTNLAVSFAHHNISPLSIYFTLTTLISMWCVLTVFTSNPYFFGVLFYTYCAHIFVTTTCIHRAWRSSYSSSNSSNRTPHSKRERD